MATTVEFRDARVDAGDGAVLAQAMRDEIAIIYPGLDLDGEQMPKAGPAELSPPGGAFLVGYHAGRPVCCGGVKRLSRDMCEIKKMYLVPELRGQGAARQCSGARSGSSRADASALMALNRTWPTPGPRASGSHIRA